MKTKSMGRFHKGYDVRYGYATPSKKTLKMTLALLDATLEGSLPTY